MKNHYLIPALVLWCAASCALAQTWSAYNKISIKPLAGTSNHTPNFGGMYDKVYARFTTEHFEAETRYMFNISGSTNRITGIIGKALVRFFPLPQLEFAVGKDLDQALPGSFFTVIDDYATDANYGQDGISVSYNFLNMCATLHMPVSQQYFTDDGFELQGAAAFTAQLPAGFATGAMVRYYGNTDFSAALFASWQQGKILEAGLGYTYNGTSAAEDAGELERLQTEILHLAMLSFAYNGKIFSTAAEGEAGIDKNGLAALYCGILPSIRLYAAETTALRLKSKIKYFAVFNKSNTKQELWEIYPYFSFSCGKNLLTTGVLLSLQDNQLSWSIPITWKYSIRQSHSTRISDDA